MSARRAARFVQVAGLLLVVGTLPAARTDAQEAGGLVGYSAVATGTAFTAQPSVPALLPVEVPAEATLALASATLSSGGQGFGRASTFFPGTLIAGIRPLLEIAAGIALPIPDYPLVVESREFEPAKHNDQPGITMSTDVDPDRSIAVANAGGLGIPGILGVHAARTVSTSTVRGTTVTATSTSTLEGVDLGVLKISSIVSTSTVTSDATTATCSGSVDVTGVTVNGQPATIDGEGVHLDGDPLLPLGPLAEVLGPVLGGTGLTVRPLGGSDSCSGATGSRSSAGLLVSIPLPEVAAIPPGGRVDLILASTSASAGASTLDSTLPPLDDPPPIIGDVVPRLPGPTFGGGPLAPVPPPAVPTGPTPEVPGLPVTQPVSYSFAGVPVPLIAGLFLLALPVSKRVRRYMDRILAIAAPT